jgi:hypothetical protein
MTNPEILAARDFLVIAVFPSHCIRNRLNSDCTKLKLGAGSVRDFHSVLLRSLRPDPSAHRTIQAVSYVKVIANDLGVPANFINGTDNIATLLLFINLNHQ